MHRDTTRTKDTSTLSWRMKTFLLILASYPQKPGRVVYRRNLVDNLLYPSNLVDNLLYPLNLVDNLHYPLKTWSIIYIIP